jgi:hypothetical protein
VISKEINRAIKNTNVGKYRKILLRCIDAAGKAFTETQYDIGYYRGLEHALYLLDQMCRDEFEKAIKPPKKGG